MAVRLLPSAEVLVVAHLKASADVTALVGARVGTELYAGDGPAVWVSLVTGSERVRRHLAAQILDVRSYGGTKAQADVLSRTVHDVLHQMPGTHAQGVVSDVRCLTLPSWSPDEGFAPPRPRYVGSYECVTHPSPS